uniref:Uncharacterized protein n=1 Tax=viral metagenome TaxID=1070528 RepID=A0A6C0HXU2_9ZZZZ
MFIIFLLALFSVIESKQQTRLCSDCKYFVPGPSIQQGKCKLFLNLCDNHPLEPQENTLWTVPTEYNESTAHYHYCFVARSSKNMCGRNGKCFSKIRGSNTNI